MVSTGSLHRREQGHRESQQSPSLTAHATVLVRRPPRTTTAAMTRTRLPLRRGLHRLSKQRGTQTTSRARETRGIWRSGGCGCLVRVQVQLAVWGGAGGRTTIFGSVGHEITSHSPGFHARRKWGIAADKRLTLHTLYHHQCFWSSIPLIKVTKRPGIAQRFVDSREAEFILHPHSSHRIHLCPQ